jgi:hypothetical protein
MRTSIISDACVLRICVCVYFNLLWKLLDSYLYAGRSFLSDFLESLQETYHNVGQCFLYEIVQRQSNVVNPHLRLKILFQHPML